jgi:hypothetical protein
LNTCWTDVLDHLRRKPDTSGCASSTSGPSPSTFENFCHRATTDSNPTMRMPGNFGNTDDWVEGCGAGSCASIGRRRRKPCVHSRFPQSSSRRSHRRTQDQFDCMWAERHHPARIYNGVGLAREYVYQNLMRHTRKMSFNREQKSCWETMPV